MREGKVLGLRFQLLQVCLYPPMGSYEVTVSREPFDICKICDRSLRSWVTMIKPWLQSTPLEDEDHPRDPVWDCGDGGLQVHHHKRQEATPLRLHFRTDVHSGPAVRDSGERTASTDRFWLADECHCPPRKQVRRRIYPQRPPRHFGDLDRRPQKTSSRVFCHQKLRLAEEIIKLGLLLHHMLILHRSRVKITDSAFSSIHVGFSDAEVFIDGLKAASLYQGLLGALAVRTSTLFSYWTQNSALFHTTNLIVKFLTLTFENFKLKMKKSEHQLNSK